ncbi:hypothetical protein BKA93DRAFT_566210 [Sparassis latifolia]
MSPTDASLRYDHYLDDSRGPGVSGQNPFDDSMEYKGPRMQMQPQQQPIPLASPKPGYAAPIAALNLAQPSRVAAPDGRQTASPEMSQLQFPKPLTLVARQGTPSIPSTPHPLQPPMTPIEPAFIRPFNAPATRDVKFAEVQPILRGNGEETLLPRRGARQGEEFWRRFSMIAKEDNRKPYAQKQSAWLKKTVTGSSRMSRWVLIMGMILLVVIIGAICLGVYVAHKSTSPSTPTAIGGSADETGHIATTAAAIAGVHGSSATSLHVTPTNTVARRDSLVPPVPTSFALPVPYPPAEFGGHAHLLRAFPPSRHRRRSYLNRTVG